MREIWKDIPNYKGFYQASNLGRVRSLKRSHLCKGGIRTIKGRLMKMTVSHNGYYGVSLYKNGEWKGFRVNRLIAMVFIPNPKNKPIAHHIDSNRKNNKVKNLKWVTYSENNKEAYTSGYQIRTFGELHKQSKLTQKQVNEIRKKYLPYKYSIRKLSKEYLVSKGCIQAIIENHSWKTQTI